MLLMVGFLVMFPWEYEYICGSWRGCLPKWFGCRAMSIFFLFIVGLFVLLFIITKGKHVVLRTLDHKALVREGLATLQKVNASINTIECPFVVVSDPEGYELKRFWFKVRCKVCGNFFQLCPPNKNLDTNLDKHGQGLKHNKLLEDALFAPNYTSSLSTWRRVYLLPLQNPHKGAEMIFMDGSNYPMVCLGIKWIALH